MACGKKQFIQSAIEKKTFIMKTVLNAFVMSHLCYCSHLIQSVDQSMHISHRKQLNWAIHACYSRSRMDWTSDQEIKYSIIPVEYLKELKITTYMLKLRNCPLPAFIPLDDLTMPTWCIKQYIESGDRFFKFIYHNQKLEHSIINTASKDCNSLKQEQDGLE